MAYQPAITANRDWLPDVTIRTYGLPGQALR